MSDDVYSAIFTIAEKLEIPVLVLALAALVLLVVETGGFVAELVTRRRRSLPALTTAATSARQSLDDARPEEAAGTLSAVAWTVPVTRSLQVFASSAGRPGADNRLAKELADFDFSRQRRLGRTRLLVRIGPALGLMGTLIPLSPALDGLARGDVTTLTDNLRVAFSVTVLGIFIGGVAFALSLARERMYGQDYSDLEYVAAILTTDESERVA